VEHIKIDEVEMSAFEQWLSNMVDTFNYDMATIIANVPALAAAMAITNFDPAPIQYFHDSLNKMVKNVNSALDKLADEMTRMDSRINALGG
jgi:hypothetical protein